MIEELTTVYYAATLPFTLVSRDAAESLDLIKAINLYRAHSHPAEAARSIGVNESDEENYQAMIYLWEILKGMSAEELAELAITTIHEIY